MFYLIFSVLKTLRIIYSERGSILGVYRGIPFDRVRKICAIFQHSKKSKSAPNFLENIVKYVKFLEFSKK